MNFVHRGDESISLANLILEGGEELLYVVQWSDYISWTVHKMEHYHNAKTLIQLAEVMVCGSIGGFDVVTHKGNLITQRSHPFHSTNWKENEKYDPIFTRWLWLFTFYLNDKQRNLFGNIKLKRLKKAFKLPQ